MGTVLERRKDERYPYPATVEFEHVGVILKGVTFDISKTGASLYVFKKMSEGQEIRFTDKLPVTAERAIVRWVARVDGNFYRIGVMFSRN